MSLLLYYYLYIKYGSIQIEVYFVAFSNIGRVYFCHDLGVSGSSSQTEAYTSWLLKKNPKERPAAVYCLIQITPSRGF